MFFSLYSFVDDPDDFSFVELEVQLKRQAKIIKFFIFLLVFLNFVFHTYIFNNPFEYFQTALQNFAQSQEGFNMFFLYGKYAYLDFSYLSFVYNLWHIIPQELCVFFPSFFYALISTDFFGLIFDSLSSIDDYFRIYCYSDGFDAGIILMDAIFCKYVLFVWVLVLFCWVFLSIRFKSFSVIGNRFFKFFFNYSLINKVIGQFVVIYAKNAQGITKAFVNAIKDSLHKELLEFGMGVIGSKFTILLFWVLWFFFFWADGFFFDNKYPSLLIVVGDFASETGFLNSIFESLKNLGGNDGLNSNGLWLVSESENENSHARDRDPKAKAPFNWHIGAVLVEQDNLSFVFKNFDFFFYYYLELLIFFFTNYANDNFYVSSGFNLMLWQLVSWIKFKSQFSWIIFGPGYVWSFFLQQQMDLDYVSLLSYQAWDHTWLFLNRIFVLLNADLLNNVFDIYSNSNSLFYSFWIKWLTIHADWSLYLIDNLDFKLELRSFFRFQTAKSLNKSIIWDCFNQYYSKPKPNFKWSENLNKKQKFEVYYAVIKKKENLVQNNKPIGLNLLDVQNSVGVLGDIDPDVISDTVRGRGPEPLNYKPAPWVLWELYIQERLYNFKLGKFGVDYYRQDVSEIVLEKRWNNINWEEHVFGLTSGIIQYLNYFWWCFLEVLLPNNSESFNYFKYRNFFSTAMYYYVPKDWRLGFFFWLRDFDFFLSLYNIKKVGFDFSAYTGVGDIFFLGIDPKMRTIDSVLYSKLLHKLYYTAPQLNVYLFKNFEEFLNKNLSKNVFISFLTDNTFGWKVSTMQVLSKSYCDLFDNLYNEDLLAARLKTNSLLLKKNAVPKNVAFSKTMDSYLNNYNIGKGSVKVFLSQMLLDRYQFLFGRGLGVFYFVMPGWWKTRWFNYFLTYTVMEYQLVLSSSSKLNEELDVLPDYFVQKSVAAQSKSSNIFVAKYVDLEFDKFIFLLEQIDVNFYEKALKNQNIFLKNSNSFKINLLHLNKIFYFGFINYPSNFYLYSMLDLLSGFYERSLGRRKLAPEMSTVSLDLLAADLGLYLSYFGYLRQNVYTFNDHVLGFQYFGKHTDSFVWKKVILTTWESFVLNLYGFYKNEVGLSYFYSNLTQDANQIASFLKLLPITTEFWSEYKTIFNYLSNINTFKYYKHQTTVLDFTASGIKENNELFLKPSALCDNGYGYFATTDGDIISIGYPIFTLSGVDAFFRRSYDYKVLVLHEHEQVLARELYYWGNSWYRKNCGGFSDVSSGFLMSDLEFVKIKYNKSSKLFDLYLQNIN